MSKPLCFTGLKVPNAGQAGATDGGKAGGINGGHPVLESNMFEYSRSLPVHRYLFASLALFPPSQSCVQDCFPSQDAHVSCSKLT
jgi:hypothetical protein